ncbi:hypothetical protein CL658_03950 [bacterium]|nr:hypothetical protein [bacterium]
MNYRSYNNGGNYFYLGILIFFMFGGFKVLFLFLPLLFSLAPIFLLLFIGSKILKTIFSNSSIHKSIHNSSKERLHYVELMIHLMAHAIKADGIVDKREIQTLFTFFQSSLQFNSNQLRWIQDLIHYSLQKNYPLEIILQSMNQEFQSHEKQLSIELLMAVIMADESLHKNEKILLDNVAKDLQIDTEFYNQLKAKYIKSTVSNYDILGLKENASTEDIKKAYKNLCKQYHPDKVQHLGEEFKNFADKKIKEINKAYDNIMQTAKA